MDILATLFIIIVSIGVSLFFIGYLVLFLAAFSYRPKFSIWFLLIIGFSSVAFIYFGKPWYYSLPLWFIPPIFTQFMLEKTPNLKKVIIWFWLGFIILILSGLLFYQGF